MPKKAKQMVFYSPNLGFKCQRQGFGVGMALLQKPSDPSASSVSGDQGLLCLFSKLAGTLQLTRVGFDHETAATGTLVASW